MQRIIVQMFVLYGKKKIPRKTLTTTERLASRVVEVLQYNACIMYGRKDLFTYHPSLTREFY